MHGAVEMCAIWTKITVLQGNRTSSSAVAKRPRDASCHWICREVTQDHSKWHSWERRKARLVFHCKTCSYLVPFRRYSELNNGVTLKFGFWGRWRSVEMTPFERLGTVSYSHFEATMGVSFAVCEIFSVNEWHDLENWVRGCSRSLKMALSDRPYTTFYWSATVNIAVSCTIFELLIVE